MNPGPKPRESVLMQVLVSPALKEAIEKIAARRGTSASQVIRDMIDEHVKKYSEKK